MSKLSKSFQDDQAVSLDLEVPPVAMQALWLFSDITGTDDLCIGGGFVRGLYMQQHLGLSPKMNDIDVFADLPIERFEAVRDKIEKQFGQPIRFHVGRFIDEDHRRGLIEFALPVSFESRCAGVKSLQFNFGLSYPWANPFDYIAKANLGVNQVAVDMSGDVIASPLFVSDMANRKMTMNPDIEWSAYDWERTSEFMDRAKIVRPEFAGWESVLVDEPKTPTAGKFWDQSFCNQPIREP